MFFIVLMFQVFMETVLLYLTILGGICYLLFWGLVLLGVPVFSAVLSSIGVGIVVTVSFFYVKCIRTRAP